jgi:hypothetical protein
MFDRCINGVYCSSDNELVRLGYLAGSIGWLSIPTQLNLFPTLRYMYEHAVQLHCLFEERFQLEIVEWFCS